MQNAPQWPSLAWNRNRLFAPFAPPTACLLKFDTTFSPKVAADKRLHTSASNGKPGKWSFVLLFINSLCAWSFNSAILLSKWLIWQRCNPTIISHTVHCPPSSCWGLRHSGHHRLVLCGRDCSGEKFEASWNNTQHRRHGHAKCLRTVQVGSAPPLFNVYPGRKKNPTHCNLSISSGLPSETHLMRSSPWTWWTAAIVLACPCWDVLSLASLSPRSTAGLWPSSASVCSWMPTRL